MTEVNYIDVENEHIIRALISLGLQPIEFKTDKKNHCVAVFEDNEKFHNLLPHAKSYYHFVHGII